MDILTPRGQISREDERRAVEIFSSHYPTYSYVDTPKDSPAIIDAILVTSGSMYSAVETKCRDINLETFLGEFKGRWLVTYDKIEKARQIAVSLGIGLSGFLYLKRSDTLLIDQIADKNGLFTKRIYIEATQTQRTINGGLAVRNNAYIDMSNAKQCRVNT